MRPFIASILALSLGTFLTTFLKATYAALAGAPAGAMYAAVPSGILKPTVFEGSLLLGLVYFTIPIAASLYGGEVLGKSVALGSCAFAFIATFLAWFMPRVTPLTRVERISIFEYLGYYCLMIVVLYFCGLGVGKTLLAIENKFAPPKPENGSRRRPPKRYDLGFTLFELLTCTLILAVLASILFPVFARAKRSGYVAEDISKLHQIYLGLTMYEEDNDRAAPDSLIDLVPKYIPSAELTTHLDTRTAGSRPLWPANVWSDILDSDGSYATATTKTMVGFAYLKTFSSRFPPNINFEGLNQDPSVGLLLDPSVGGCNGPCLFGDGAANLAQGEPAYNVSSFLVVRTDGSLAKRSVPTCRDGSLSYEMMFLFAPITCEATGTQ